MYKLLIDDVTKFNEFRKINPGNKVNLRMADLSGINLYGADLREVNLCQADLSEADLRGANLRGANLRGANLIEANLYRVDLSEANLREADLRGADLSESNLYRADLIKANLFATDLRGADLSGALITPRLKALYFLFDPRGYPLIPWYRDGCLYIKGGCHDFTIEEALAHWGSPEYLNQKRGALWCKMVRLVAEMLPEELI